MRSLNDIIEAVKDGEKPDYDELRYALLVLDFIGTMTQSMVLGLYGKDNLNGFDKLKIDNNYKMRQKAFSTDPKHYIGSFDPDLPGYQEDRARSQRIFNGLRRNLSPLDRAGLSDKAIGALLNLSDEGRFAIDFILRHMADNKE